MMCNIGPALRKIGVLLAAVLSVTVLWSCQKQENQGTEKKNWKLSMIKYDELRQTRDAEAGFRSGLDLAGLKEGEDYTIVTRNAQGNADAVLSLIDATAADGTDMIISLQTPTLHTAVQRGEGLPLVFMVVANPFVISDVGRNDKDHLPFLTGVYTNTTFTAMMDYIKQAMPNVRRIGTLFSQSELNATFYKGELIDAASQAGLQLETYGVSYKSSVPQATQSLIDLGIDAICQIEDNLTSATFPSIIKVARENNIPVFSFVDEQAHQGSVIVVAPDYIQGAMTAAELTVRIMRGESPGDIPFARIQKFNHIVNLKAARDAGLDIPQSVIDRADNVLNED
ncbi:MAG: ABC transporter substrate-binding protein [Bacteroidota bacterium]|nr:ABC transporter substrate-binding protein [Bacteroidota bacterium]